MLVTKGMAAPTQQQGHIQVVIKPHKQHVQISVKDTGIGIPSAFLPKLFEEYSQENPFQQGHGLGLAVAKRLVTLLNGKIEVESEVSQGSTFTVTLPRPPSCTRDAAPLPRKAYTQADYESNGLVEVVPRNNKSR
jgi:signal transduction histidine kinase